MSNSADTYRKLNPSASLASFNRSKQPSRTSSLMTGLRGLSSAGTAAPQGAPGPGGRPGPGAGREIGADELPFPFGQDGMELLAGPKFAPGRRANTRGSLDFVVGHRDVPRSSKSATRSAS